MEWLKEYWYIISFVLTMIIFPTGGFFIGKYKAKLEEEKKKEEKKKEDLELLKSAIKTMQKNSLYKSCEDFTNRGYSTMEAKETIEEQYESYHALGGDTFITSMVRKVMALPNNKD